MATVTTSSNGDLVGTYYLNTFIEFLKSELHFYQQGRKQGISAGNGNVLKGVRASTFSAASTPLTEGTAPSSTNVTINPVTVTPRQWGAFCQYSDTAATESISPIVEQLSELNGYQSGLTVDYVIQADLHSNCTTKIGGGASSNGATEASTATVLSAGGIRKVKQLLSSAGAMKFPDGTYHAVIDPHCTADLLADSGVGSITSINQYVDAGRDNLMKGIVGKAGGITFFESANIQNGTGSGSATTYRNFVFGKDAYLCVDVGRGGVEFIYIPVTGTPSISDPLRQNGATGWKALFDAVVTNSSSAVELITVTNY
jgi:N4-gp56 family major capsid protein